MFHFHSIHFLGLFAKSYPQYMTFWKCQYFPLRFLKSLPTVNYLNITKFRKEEILPSRNSSFSCKHAYVFVTSQPKIFVLVWQTFRSLFKLPKIQKCYHWRTEEVRKHQIQERIWSFCDYWTLYWPLFTTYPPWVGEAGENVLVKYNHFWQDISSLKEVNKIRYNSKMNCRGMFVWQ